MKQRPDITQVNKRNAYSGRELPTRQQTVAQPTRPVAAAAPRQARWFLLPLRLFLGITFVYAGIQKLTDPQYFNASVPGYIGKQIAAFATGSPLHGFLMGFVVPHAHFFGALVAYGEIAIGLGVLVGLLLRPAAFFGLLLSLIFFFSATWHVYPYFYGADIVFVFCWITLLLAGPLHSGLPSLDAFLVPRFLQSLSQEERASLSQPLHLLIGVGDSLEEDNGVAVGQGQNRQQLPRPATPRGRYAAARYAQQSRRNFLLGMVTGGVAMLGLAWVGTRLRLGGRLGDDEGYRGGAASTGSSSSSTGSSSSATPGTTTIAQVSAVPKNSSVSFTIPSNGDPGILVHLNNDQFVAYDATCTHAGCPVDYDPSQQLLVCPCHGAAFDPAQNGAVVQPPARDPLTSVTIHVDSATGAITL